MDENTAQEIGDIIDVLKESLMDSESDSTKRKFVRQEYQELVRAFNFMNMAYKGCSRLVRMCKPKCRGCHHLLSTTF